MEGAWSPTGKHAWSDPWVPQVLQAPASLPATLALVPLGEEGSAASSLARVGPERWAALGWRVLSARQSRRDTTLLLAEELCLHPALSSSQSSCHPTSSYKQLFWCCSMAVGAIGKAAREVSTVGVLWTT